MKEEKGPGEIVEAGPKPRWLWKRKKRRGERRRTRKSRSRSRRERIGLLEGEPISAINEATDTGTPV